MRNRLTGAAIAALGACSSVAMVQSDVTLYGRLNTSLEYSDASTWRPARARNASIVGH